MNGPQGDQNVRHVPWVDEPEGERFENGNPKPGYPTEVRLGSSTFQVDGTAAVRHRGDVAFLNYGGRHGRVRVLSERGEVVLTEAQELALREAWVNL